MKVYIACATSVRLGAWLQLRAPWLERRRLGWLSLSLLLLSVAGCATAGPAEIDQAERIIWTASDDEAGRLCWERYGLRDKVACYGNTDNVIVVSRTSPWLLWHERCHRSGWPADHPWPPPAACR